MTSEYDRLMRRVFGDAEWDKFSDEVRSAALRVAEWYDTFGTDSLSELERHVADSVWDASRQELGHRAELLSTPRRDRDLNDVRACMYRITHELLPFVPKSKISRVLNINRDHATVLYSMTRADELITLDPGFRALYLRLYRRVIDKMEEGDE